jgi:hypothetical protein
MKEIIVITHEQSLEIIESRTPKGLFVVIHDGVYVAIDNESSNAFTEQFSNLEDVWEFLGTETMNITGIDVVSNDIIENSLTKKINQLSIDVAIANRENSRLREELNARIRRIEYYENLNASLSKRLDAGAL